MKYRLFSVKLAHGILMMGIALASMLSSRRASADWIMGSQQWAADQTVSAGGDTSTVQYYTEIVTEFQVPAAPTTFMNPVSLWTGLEGTTQGGSYVLQPVLVYEGFLGGDGPTNWWMQNESDCNGACGSLPQGDVANGQTQVFPMDWILAAVWMDDNNYGTGCNVFTGASCNYNIGFWDLTQGSGPNFSSVRMDAQVPTSPNYALPLVFEAPTGAFGLTPNFDGCANFPAHGTSTAAYTQLMTFTWSGGLFTAISPNYVDVGLPAPYVPAPYDSAFPPQPLQGPPTAAPSAIPFCGWQFGVGLSSASVALTEMGW